MKHAVLILSILALSAGCGGESPTTPSAAPTPVPLLLVAPSDGAVLSAQPRSVMLQWSEVTDPSGVSYTVEIELGYPGSTEWTPIPEASGHYGECAGRLRTTSCLTHDFPGDQPGRWRVTAETGSGRRSGPTPWRAFRFTAPAGRFSTQVFRFALPAGSRGAVFAGSVQAAEGPLEVTLSFSGDFIVLACVGPTAFCYPMGGRPMTSTFTIPHDFPAGFVQARVYFNPNYPQPAGDVSGTVTFVYKAQ